MMDNVSEYEISVLEPTPEPTPYDDPFRDGDGQPYRDNPYGDSDVRDDPVLFSADDPMSQRQRNKTTRAQAQLQQEGQDGPKASGAQTKRIVGAKWYQTKRPGSTIAVLAATLFLLVLGGTMMIMPLMRLMEDAICRRHYGVGFGGQKEISGGRVIDGSGQFIDDEHARPEDRLCKIPPVQAELAFVGGVISVSFSLVGLIASFPWALLSDRLGRKPVLCLSLSGLGVSTLWSLVVMWRRDVLPVWLVLLALPCMLVGGGVGVSGTVLHSIVVDVAEPDDRASGFVRMATGAVLGSILGPSIAAKLMQKTGSAWWPIGLTVFVAIPLCAICLCFLPETLKTRSPAKNEPFSSSSSSSTSPSSPSSSSPFSSSLPASPPRLTMANLSAHLHDTWTSLGASMRVLRRSRSALLLLPTFLVYSAAHAVEGGILSQVVSARFGWSLAQTGYLMSLKGIVTVVVLILLPGVSAILTGKAGRYCTALNWLHLTASAKDLLLARISLVFLIVGSLLLAGPSLACIIAGLIVSTFSVGLMAMVKSLITALYEDALGDDAIIERNDSDHHESNSASNDSNDSNDINDSNEENARNEHNDNSDSKETVDHTSRLFTLTHMVETAGSLLGGPVVALLYSIGLKAGGFWTGLPFYYAALLCAMALFCLMLVNVSKKSIALV